MRSFSLQSLRRSRGAWFRRVSAVVLAVLLMQACERRRSAEGLRSVDERPDIIVILVDALRADYLGCYGFQGEISPAIDRLALESVVYDAAIAPSPWTKPSVASLFTSLDPLTHKVVTHGKYFWKGVPASQKTDALPKEAWSLAEGLGELGYETAAWVTNPWINEPQWGFDQGFDHFYDRRDKKAKLIIPEIQEWFEEWAEGPKGDRPLFLYLHFMDVHGPYDSTPELIDEFSQSPSLGGDRLLTEREHKAIGYLGKRTPWRDSEQGEHLKNWRAAYASGVRLFDDQLGPFLSWLRNSQRLKKSALVFTSDHGEDLLEHGRWNHGYAPSLFQHSIKIPLMIRLPGAKGGGRRDDRMTGLLDVMPTLLYLAGQQSIPEQLEGHALLDSKGRGSANAPAWSFSGAVADNPRMVSIQDRDYKLIWEFPRGSMRLYDLRDDLDEKVNLASSEPEQRSANPSMSKVKRKMVQTLAARIRRLRAGPSLLKTQVAMDSDTVERLKSLGYLQ